MVEYLWSNFDSSIHFPFNAAYSWDILKHVSNHAIYSCSGSLMLQPIPLLCCAVIPPQHWEHCYIMSASDCGFCDRDLHNLIWSVFHKYYSPVITWSDVSKWNVSVEQKQTLNMVFPRVAVLDGDEGQWNGLGEALFHPLMLLSGGHSDSLLPLEPKFYISRKKWATTGWLVEQFKWIIGFGPVLWGFSTVTEDLPDLLLYETALFFFFLFLSAT